MFRDFGNLGFADFEIGVKPFGNWLALQKIVTLTHHADGEETQLSFAELVSGEFAEGWN